MPVSKKRKLTPAQIIASAQRAEQTVTVCLRADLVNRIAALEDELQELATNRPDDVRMGGGTSVSAEEKALAEQVHALELEADEHSLDLTIRALRKDEWRAAKAANPANEADSALGWAVDRDAVAESVLVESVVSPELDPDALIGMVAELGEGQWWPIRDAIIAVNGGDGSVPFTSRASLIRRLSSSADGSPDLTAFQSDSSTDGNLAP